jgi:hypothetical protein
MDTPALIEADGWTARGRTGRAERERAIPANLKMKSIVNSDKQARAAEGRSAVSAAAFGG